MSEYRAMLDEVAVIALSSGMIPQTTSRAIVLNSPICKLFETVILSKAKENLRSSDMQFGYKKGVSTNCTYVVSEIDKMLLEWWESGVCDAP
jgi:hypothetical protein